MRKCSTCKILKSIEDFYINRRNKDGLKSNCKKCCAESVMKCYWKDPIAKKEYIRQWQLKNPGVRYETARKSDLKIKYGITLEDYNRMFDAQLGKCHICKKHQIEFKKKLAVDHNHQTGKVRGLLCEHCNKALGGFRDNIEYLEEAIKYLNTTDY